MDSHHRLTSTYRQLNADEIELMNEIIAHGKALEALTEKLKISPDLDQRWVSIGTTDLQKGLMALSRAVSKPMFF